MYMCFRVLSWVHTSDFCRKIACDRGVRDTWTKPLLWPELNDQSTFCDHTRRMQFCRSCEPSFNDAGLMMILFRLFQLVYMNEKARFYGHSLAETRTHVKG